MKQQYLVTITDHDGRCIETYIHEQDDPEDPDEIFWNLRVLIDPHKDIQVIYLPAPKNKPSRLIKERYLG